MNKYKTILIDPPWEQKMMLNTWKRRPNTAEKLPYQTLSLQRIKNLPIAELADVGCHVWLWTTNSFLRAGFDCLEAWGIKYLAPITWRKPSGQGYWFVHTTQTILFGYNKKCKFNLERFLPTCFDGNARKHSQKPEISYSIIERVSMPPRLELFARNKRDGWDTWGNEVDNSIEFII